MRIALGTAITNFNYPLSVDPIAALFKNGEEGAWYDPSDLTTLYQDANGFTPVTGTGQPVGLMLDKSKGLTLGSELFSDFATEGLWTDNGNGSWSITNAASITDLRSATLGVTGKRYRIEITFTVSSGLVAVYPLNTSPYSVSSGQTKVVFTEANYGVISDQLWIRAAAGTTATVSNISVKELPGNHATQATSTARPTLQLDGSSYYLDFDGVDDYLQTAPFSANQSQPNSLAAAFKFTTLARTEFVLDGIGANRNTIYKVSGPVQAYAGTALVSTAPGDLAEQVAFVEFSTTTSFIRNNGVLNATGDTGASPWGGITIGTASSATGNFLDGRIYGAIGVNRSLTAVEIIDVERYLALKTGAFSAPAIFGVPIAALL